MKGGGGEVPLAIFLGPDKAGSSWMFRVAAWHPHIAVPRAKDLFFFDRFYDRGITWYESRFPITGQTRVRLEICHDYLFSVEAADRIRHHYPGARLLVCLRHPVDRAVSSYLYMVRQGRVRDDFPTALRTVGELLDHGRYGTHIATYLARFPRDQLHVLDFDGLRTDPRSFSHAFFRSVGVHTATPPADLLVPVRPASAPRVAAVAKVGKRVAEGLRQRGREDLVGRLKDSELVERLLFRRLSAGDRVRATPDDVAYLRNELRGDTVLLDRQLGTRYVATWWDDPAGDGSSGPGAGAAPARTASNRATTRAGATQR